MRALRTVALTSLAFVLGVAAVVTSINAELMPVALMDCAAGDMVACEFVADHPVLVRLYR